MQEIISRLKRIEGQIGGLRGLIEKGEDCEAIIIQFQAVLGAMESAFSEALATHLDQCLVSKDPKSMKKIVKLLAKRQGR